MSESVNNNQATPSEITANTPRPPRETGPIPRRVREIMDAIASQTLQEIRSGQLPRQRTIIAVRADSPEMLRLIEMLRAEATLVAVDAIHDEEVNSQGTGKNVKEIS